MTTEKQWLERVRAWRGSGVSAAEFCEGQPFSAVSLRAWSSRLGQEGKVARAARGRWPLAVAKPSMGFARVVTVATGRAGASAGPAKSMTVRVGASRIEVCADFDPRLLRAVVEALSEESP